MHTPLARLLPRITLVAALLLAACGDDGTTSPEGDAGPWLLDPTEDLPSRLSSVGLFSDMLSATPSDLVEPFTVRYPLFSDGNLKTRHAFLPEGTTIDVSDPDAWEMPVGATFFKTFSLTANGNPVAGAPRIETRILHKRDDGWTVGTYQWNDDQTDAVLTSGSSVRRDFELPGGSYTYTIPGNADCRSCHDGTVDFVAAFEAVQLGPGLDEFESLEWFSGAVDPIEIEGTEAERAALGYLHGNCANCHSPDGPAWFSTGLDLRHGEAVESTVDRRPRKFFSTNPAIRLIRPGIPDSSLVYMIMAGDLLEFEAFMPPLGTSKLDEEGLQILSTWIDELGTRP